MTCEWTEEEIVDFVLGRLSREKEDALKQHMDECSECRDRFREWEELFDENREKTVVPSPAVKHRLMKEIRPKRGLKMPMLGKPAWAFMAVCTMFLLGIGLFSFAPHSGETEHVENKPIVAKQNGTRAVRYVPVNDHRVKGYVWLNASTDELLLHLKGLSDIHGKDYQVWLIAPGHQANAGVLQVNGGEARLYFHGPEMKDARHIIVTVEPLGGSHMQTGPEKFFIQLGQ
jgi:anti-sigma-K factor RskA